MVPPPQPRGPLSQWLMLPAPSRTRTKPPKPVPGTGFGEDVQLALYIAYESHYGDAPGGDFDEWDPSVIAVRRSLEREFEASLERAVTTPRRGDPWRLIPEMIAADHTPSVSSYIERHGTLDQVRDVVIHRSAYQLKEADPHTFGIPRLRGRAKQLLASIQAGEYGADGHDRRMHAELFAHTMRSLGLDDRPNAYLDRLPASALMISNLISLFGLNRRWRGALVGHLTVFEMTSVEPMGRYARGLDRLGAPAEARRFYDVHVLADAEHEVIALEMAGTLAETEPELAGDVLFGAGAALAVEARVARDLFGRWAHAPALPHASVA